MTALEGVLISARIPHGKYNFFHLTNNNREAVGDLKPRTPVVQKQQSGQSVIQPSKLILQTSIWKTNKQTTYLMIFFLPALRAIPQKQTVNLSFERGTVT